jgi:hypothetical protein
MIQDYEDCILIYAGLECEVCFAYYNGGRTNILPQRAKNAQQKGWLVQPKGDDFEVFCPKCAKKVNRGDSPDN